MRYRISMGAAALATALLAAPSLAQVVDFGKYPAFVGQWGRTGPPNNWRQLAGPPPLTAEAYVRNTADGELMPSTKNQSPPDLRYFKPTQK
ncbi:MAG TPA: hypothetical protein VG291_17780 [Xanthobacteraceae bacterium]|jgi:hypothetical protein|nr:hypothetical protein [Xanthobacteraceae bacterium]